jgi:hypothetical protein
MLDLLAGEATERTELMMTSKAPFRFPARATALPRVKLAQLAGPEDRDGHRDLLLKAFDAFGIGFDS